jgi:AcrR family transcriptional regulator
VAHRRTRRKRGAARSRSGKAAATARGRAVRREAILAAALEEFAVGGFAATRLDDIARRAGVAKGTIYLYFRDKEALFQELLRSMFSPLVDALSAMPAEDLPVREVAERMIAIFIREVLGTRRKDVIRLVIAEGKRFPKLAEFHFREVIGRIMPMVSALLARAAQRGEIDPRLPQFPQLLAAPGVVAIVWQALFDRLAPLNVEAMMRVHLDLLFGPKAS